jgi:ATP-dependent DNA helicase RecG
MLPVTAAREVLVNAVAHRDYAIMGSKVLVERFTDRLEVTSPGRLPNGITLASVTRGGNPRTRNQSMMNYLLAMGKMEQRGRGWPIIHSAMQDLNGTTPMIEEDRDARWVRVTLKTATDLDDG